MICIWADGSWCWAHEAAEYTHKSDDYASVRVPEWFDEEDCEIVAREWAEHGTTKYIAASVE